MHLLDDPYLKPFEAAVRGRSERAFARAAAFAGETPLAEWARAHEWYGLHRTRGGWVFREWAPNANAVWLVGDFSKWRVRDEYRCKRINEHGDWEVKLPAKAIAEGDNYRLEVRWPGGRGERIPAYAQYVVQDPKTHLFSAQVYVSKYRWRNEGGIGGRGGIGTSSTSGTSSTFIYETHVGMSGEEPKVSSYDDFRRNTLPRIKAAGYDTVQIMGVMEHPYYGSFGYHVSSFYAASSRFGTPDQLKRLVDEAHGMGMRVIMDLVHSHAVRNERDGLSCFDGTEHQYFHAGGRGWHTAWGSRCFDYAKPDVARFLLSNCRFWLEEYHFDGYRFDGVTSMLYYDHGLGAAFTNYGMYFNGSVDEDAWTYLQLANRVIHAVKPTAITIAEDVSGIPGCAAPVEDCGLGFDYRMAMGEPDNWFRLAEKVRDEDWSMSGLYYSLTDKRAEEKVVSYVESHDQALVGGKTFFFQLADAAIYWGMGVDQHGLEVDRAVALHKMARLATCALNGGAYLNFMGNEFGHPEWIDFPREENGWSYAHARRQWSLRDDPKLQFKGLADFDAKMLETVATFRRGDWPVRLVADDSAKVLAFVRGKYLFVFNFHPSASYDGYGVLVPPASKWRHLFDSDEAAYGGQGRIAAGQKYDPVLEFDGRELVQQVKLYLPARTAIVLKRR